jgi:predicted RNA binding protein YcfA (HicA-like mRNA interferase family)
MGGEKLPILTARELLAIVKRLGFVPFHQRGSHLTLKRLSDGRRVTVPIHAGRTLKKGLLNGLLHDIGLTVEELNRLR